MSVDIPNPEGVNLDFIGPLDIGPVSIASLPAIHVNVDSLPKIQVGVDKLQIGVDKLQIGVDKLQVGLDPITLSLAITEIPRLRIHLPANFRLCVKVCGMELISASLCGEAQAITEPYRPHPAEVCGPPTLKSFPLPPVNKIEG